MKLQNFIIESLNSTYKITTFTSETSNFFDQNFL